MVDSGPRILNASDPIFLRRVYLFGGPTYALWQVATPDGGWDPGLLWWGISAVFPLTALASLRWESVERQLGNFWPSWLVTMHLYALVLFNPGQPFYIVASIIGVVAPVFFFRESKPLLRYAGLVATLGVGLLVFQGNTDSGIYWAGTLPVILLAYDRAVRHLNVTALTQHYQAQLEEVVSARTRDLIATNELLREEVDQRNRLEEELRLRQRMDAVARFAGGVAHEFNNLLMTIRVYTDLVGRVTPSDDPRVEDIERIRVATEQASVLAKQLLALGHTGDERVGACDLSAFLGESRGMLEHLVPEDIELSLEVEPGPLWIAAPRSQLEQVVMNLVLNARDAMQGGGRLTIRAAPWAGGRPEEARPPPRPATGDWAVLEVRDSGSGIAPQVLQRVFEPFFTTKPAGKGTGIGLWTVYTIASGAGGGVRVKSEPGGGTSFQVLWPLVEAASASVGEAIASHPSGGRGERILLVEDRVELRSALMKLLTLDGYEIIDAANGEEALERLAESSGSFAAVLTDAVMPGIDGPTLAMRARERFPWLKVLVFSAYPGHPSLRGFQSAPGFEFMVKPFEPEDLARRLRILLDESEAA